MVLARLVIDGADLHAEVLELLDVPAALLEVPLTHPDYVRRTVTAARDTIELSPTSG
ncbi:hypothetical protein [Nocardia sp. CS682]|uniref:hypothetical protein n=1 Tax=Nocardia sp. CS682 TaxID=1047172 RepID=UPI0014314CB6|nr:hypothetical protein [Nocardia sp. CS682]